jgi:hypothetical protein
MEKVIQEFRVIETDDGFRIEIKGDKEQLREFVMSLDPRRWTHHGGPEWKGPFGGGGPRPWKMRFKRGGWGPFAFGWGWDEEDEGEDEALRRKRGHGRWHESNSEPGEDVT